ncbi:hypothetical protein Tco_0989154 [Tanacetum coccineum]|uniref:Uncharacterized protein n=1 Tax=Tanacetum coccineum TaxID=301880 RepID=A0ABQ5ESY7_9ASTR
MLTSLKLFHFSKNFKNPPLQGVQTGLFKEVKVMEEIFDQMSNEVDQNVVDKQCAEIVKKNLLIENENLIANYLSNQLLFDVEKSRCLDLEAEMSKVHNESKHISKLEREYLNLQLKYQHLQNNERLRAEIEKMRLKAQLEGNLKVATRSSVKTKVLAPGIPTGKKFSSGKLNCGYQWSPQERKFCPLENCAPLIRLTSDMLLLCQANDKDPNTNWGSEIPNPPKSYKDLEILFQPMFDEYFDQSIDGEPVPMATVVNAPIVSTNTSVSTTIAQDAPSVTRHSMSILTSASSVFSSRRTSFAQFNSGDVDHLKMEMEMEIPSVKASANSDIIFFFTSAQDGNKLLDDERLSLADDLKKAHDQNQNKSK